MASVTIIGCGTTGQHTALALMKKNVCRSINLLDNTFEYAQGLALDLNQANQIIQSHTTVYAQELVAKTEEESTDPGPDSDPRSDTGASTETASVGSIPATMSEGSMLSTEQSITIVCDAYTASARDVTEHRSASPQSGRVLDASIDRSQCILYAGANIKDIQSYASFPKLIDVHGSALMQVLRACIVRSLCSLADFKYLDVSTIQCQFFLDSAYKVHLRPEWIRVGGLELSHCSQDIFLHIQSDFEIEVQAFLNARQSSLLCAETVASMAQGLLLGKKYLCPVVDVHHFTEIYMSPALVSIDGVEQFFDSEIVFATRMED